MVWGSKAVHVDGLGSMSSVEEVEGAAVAEGQDDGVHVAGAVTVILGAVFWKLLLGLSLSLSSTMSGLNGRSPDFAKLLKAC